MQLFQGYRTAGMGKVFHDGEEVWCFVFFVFVFNNNVIACNCLCL